jgi:mono/diheme cytochrome c family protein
MLTPFLIITALLFLGLPAVIQQTEPTLPPETTAPAPAAPAQAPIPAADANQPNPVHPTQESQARAKHIYQIDCAMCHGDQGSGKGDIAMTAKMLDYRDPASLKGLTDGQIFYIIKNGRGDMPPEDGRASVDETWNLVIYVRSFSKK